MDISKCSGNNCPLKKMCKRHTAPSGVWQLPPAYEDGDCINNSILQGGVQ